MRVALIAAVRAQHRRARHGQWFGQVAAEYDRWRPGYPASAVDWLAPQPPARVLEVGAGTGKLTSLLLARGLDVDAVEPDGRMREVLARSNPAARTHDAESTGLPVDDASVDAVLVADAWHWFDAEATLTEVRRVLRRGGWLGLVWHVVAEPVEQWERDLDGPGDRFDRAGQATPEGIAGHLPGIPTDELRFQRIPWTWELTPEHRARFLATTSVFIAMTDNEREKALSDTRVALQRVSDGHGRAAMPIRHEASCVRWTPRRT